MYSQQPIRRNSLGQVGPTLEQLGTSAYYSGYAPGENPFTDLPVTPAYGTNPLGMGVFTVSSQAGNISNSDAVSKTVYSFNVPKLSWDRQLSDWLAKNQSMVILGVVVAVGIAVVKGRR